MHATAQIDHRAAQLVLAARRMTDAHARFVADPELSNPPDYFFAACRDACEAFEAGDLPAMLRPLSERMDKLADKLAAYDRLDPQPNDPGEGFWAAFEGVLSVMQAPARRLATLESIEDLTAQKVPDTQICKIYGFIDQWDRPRMDLLAKERAKPGSVTLSPDGVDGKPWRDPREKDLEADFGTALADLLSQRGEYLPPVPPESPACPETIEQLFAQKVPEQQAARMLKLTVDQVAERYEALMLAEEAERKAKRK